MAPRKSRGEHCCCGAAGGTAGGTARGADGTAAKGSTKKGRAGEAPPQLRTECGPVGPPALAARTKPPPAAALAARAAKAPATDAAAAVAPVEPVLQVAAPPAAQRPHSPDGWKAEAAPGISQNMVGAAPGVSQEPQGESDGCRPEVIAELHSRILDERRRTYYGGVVTPPPPPPLPVAEPAGVPLEWHPPVQGPTTHSRRHPACEPEDLAVQILELQRRLMERGVMRVSP